MFLSRGAFGNESSIVEGALEGESCVSICVGKQRIRSSMFEATCERSVCLYQKRLAGPSREKLLVVLGLLEADVTGKAYMGKAGPAMQNYPSSVAYLLQKGEDWKGNRASGRRFEV